MRSLLVSLVLAGLLTGCFTSRPKDNVGFAIAPSLSTLNGTYQNLGEAGKNETHYLSAQIWPRERLPHLAIDVVTVRATGDSALLVTALIGASSVRQQSFVNGKDFDFRDGRLRIGKGWGLPDAEAEAPGLFLFNSSQEYGLDEKGQGKYKRTESVVGAVYLVVPIAAKDQTEVRFIRIKD